MRAQFINELNFERGSNPRASMEIGGIDFTEPLEDFLSKWKDTITKKLVGNKITTNVEEIIMRPDHSMDRIEHLKKSIIVKEIQNIYDTNSIRYGRPLWVIVCISDDNKRYRIDLDQKIWIE